MKHCNIIIAIVFTAILFSSCKKQLDINNINNPTPESATTEAGIISLAQGSIYINGFYNLKYSDRFIGGFWAGATAFHEMMGDIIGMEGASVYANQLGCPNKIITDDGTVIVNPQAPATQYQLLRTINVNALQGNNPTYYEWAYMYNLIIAANTIIDLSDKISFSGSNAATKKATIKAWAYWWRGYAYSRIGSLYYAGIKQNATYTDQSTNGNYVSKEAVIAEANDNFDKCAGELDAAVSIADYESILKQLIPAYLQKGKGGALSIAGWKHNINTMKARNMLVNNLVPDITTAQWQDILNLTNNGITASDLIFTGRTNAEGDFLASTIADKIQSTTSATNTYKLSERWVQDFTAGDRRKENNILTLNSGIGIFNQDRGISFNTRYTLLKYGAGLPGVIVYANPDAGANEITLCGTYEENELMKAEATMHVSNFSAAAIATAMACIDNVRNYQGAGLPATAATDKATAEEELRKERRIALAFKGLSFYDARRWNIIAPDKYKTGCTLLSASTGTVNTNASVVYGFLDYWDVPDNELVYNPAVSGSADTKNPKQ